MSEDSILKCLIAFILGWFLSRHMGNGFSVGGGNQCHSDRDCPSKHWCRTHIIDDNECLRDPGADKHPEPWR